MRLRGRPLRLAVKGTLAACFLLLTAGTAAADNVSFSADSVQSVLAKGREHTVLSGRARVLTGKVSISADRIELFGKDFQYMQCSGSVFVKDEEAGITLRSPDLYYDRELKLSRATGPSVLEDSKNKLVLKAEWIENDGVNEVMIAEVGVHILKEDLACSAEYAIYRRNDKHLELTGAPSADKNGDVYHATRIVVNTDTEEISLEGDVGGTVVSNSKNENGASSSGTPSARAPETKGAPPAQGTKP
ncbi:MAG: LptA/OstA family protein [Rectinemataceae bacterium]